MSWWDLTRKMRDTKAQPARTRLMHWEELLTAMVTMVVCFAMLGLASAFTGSPNGRGVPEPVMRSTWSAALDTAHATATERATIPRPPVVLYPAYRMRPMPGVDCGQKPGERCLMRLCGETFLFLTTTPSGDMDWTSSTNIYLRPEEGALIGPVLLHEYLHTIWAFRCERDALFCRANSDSEAWVQSLVATLCPAP